MASRHSKVHLEAPGAWPLSSLPRGSRPQTGRLPTYTHTYLVIAKPPGMWNQIRFGEQECRVMCKPRLLPLSWGAMSLPTPAPPSASSQHHEQAVQKPSLSPPESAKKAHRISQHSNPLRGCAPVHPKGRTPHVRLHKTFALPSDLSLLSGLSHPLPVYPSIC